MSHAQWALVTGASSGIGEALAACFARDGINLVLVARSEDKLQALAQRWRGERGIEVKTLCIDLALTDGADQVFAALDGLVPSYLVNNAGIGLYGKVQDTDLDAEQRLLDLNIRSLTRLCKLCLPAMLAQGYGHILNLASTAAFQPGPYMAVYYASKAYVLSLSEAMAEDLKGTGVMVTALCPGPTRSGFQAGAGMEGTGLFKRLAMAEVGQVAEVGYRAMMNGRRLAIPGFGNKLLVQSLRLLPRRWVTAMVAWLSRPAKFR